MILAYYKLHKATTETVFAL